MKLDLKEWIAKVTANTPKQITISGTTSSTGAIAIPSQYMDKTLFGLHTVGSTNLVYQRDGAYLTVMYQNSNSTLVPRANTSVVISAYVMGGVVHKLLNALKPLTLERGWAV